MKHFIPAILWSILIFILSAGPGIQLPEKWWDLSPDKLGHLFVYGVQCFLLLYAIQKKNGEKCSRQVLIGITILCSLYGIAMEIMQFCFFPGRYFENMDIIANILGALLGMTIFKKIFQKNHF